jgi:hypothetical protein
VHLDADHGWQPDRVVDLGMPGLQPRWATVGFGSVWITSLDPQHWSSTSTRIVRVDYSDLR